MIKYGIKIKVKKEKGTNAYRLTILKQYRNKPGRNKIRFIQPNRCPLSVNIVHASMPQFVLYINKENSNTECFFTSPTVCNKLIEINNSPTVNIHLTFFLKGTSSFNYTIVSPELLKILLQIFKRISNSPKYQKHKIFSTDKQESDVIYI